MHILFSHNIKFFYKFFILATFYFIICIPCRGYISLPQYLQHLKENVRESKVYI